MNIRTWRATDRECASLILYVIGLAAMIGAAALGRTNYALLCMLSGSVLCFVGTALIPSPSECAADRCKGRA